MRTRWLKRMLIWTMGRFSTSQLVTFVCWLVAQKVRSLSADEALRFLFRLDAALYVIQGQTAIEYEGGIHPKHRHMRYHGFFTSRVCSGERVLDIGCGNGAVAYDVAEKAGAFVTGVDLSAEAIQQAHLHYSHSRVSYI